MREALAGLTLRGRAFVAAGVTAVVCAVLLGQPALTRVGVLVLALPLLTAAYVGRNRYRLALVRTVSPQLVTAGQPARVGLTMTNQGRTPHAVLLVEDQLPYVLGTRPRFVLDGIGQGWRREVSYQVRSDVRGRYDVGPMTVRVSDPFGLVELGRSFQTSVPLTVTPRVVPLPPINLGGGSSGSGDNRPRAFAHGSAEDVTVREYRRGDDLRRVHWLSSARTGELMVRREEQPWQARATLFIDNRAGSHRGQGVASSLETAVVAAASIAAHLGRRGFAVRLVTAAGEDAAAAWHVRDATLDTGPILESLAVLQPLRATHLDTGWLREQGQGGLVIAVLGDLTQADLPVLRRMHHGADAGLAVALDVAAWGTGVPTAPGASGAAVLSRQGWRSVGLGPRDRLDAAWQDLGRSRATAPRSHGATSGPGTGIRTGGGTGATTHGGPS